jgi:hypothetical protein
MSAGQVAYGQNRIASTLSKTGKFAQKRKDGNGEMNFPKAFAV